MLIIGDALIKTLVKSQKIIFLSKKIALNIFFFFWPGDTLTHFY